MRPDIVFDDFQIEDLARLIRQPKCILGHDPGGRKTAIATLFCEYAWKEFKVRSVWIQTKSLIDKNRLEIIDFSHFKPEEVVILRGTPEQRLKLMQSDAKVYLTTADNWRREWKQILKYNPDIGVNICDEFHLYYSTHKSKRTQEWYESCKRMYGVVPMTGTIVRGRLSSVFPAINVIEPKMYGTYENFMSYHAEFDEFGKPVGWKNYERLADILEYCGMFRSFESIYGPEAKVIQIVPMEMDERQRQAYDDFEQLGIIETDDAFIESKNGGVDFMRKRQICAHPHTFGIMPENEWTPKELFIKDEVLTRLETGEPLCIFASLQPEQERIVKLIKEVGGSVELINANTSGPKRGVIDKEFQEGKLQFVVGSPITCGVGFNWNHVDVCIFASLDSGDDSFVQAYRRFIRGKREKPLLILILDYINSVDQRIEELIDIKSLSHKRVNAQKEKFSLSQRIQDATKKEVSMAAFLS